MHLLSPNIISFQTAHTHTHTHACTHTHTHVIMTEESSNNLLPISLSQTVIKTYQMHFVWGNK